MNENITDAQALEALKGGSSARAQIADTFATRTILYPVEIERKLGEKKVEIRPYVLMGQYYPARKWEKALDVEKRYAQLNKEYRTSLKTRKLPTDRKDPGNLLQATPLDIGA